MPTSKSNGNGNSKMNKKDLEFFKKLLLKHKQELSNDIRSMAQDIDAKSNESSDISGHVQHMADVATDMYDKEFNLGLASKDREIINKIDEALRRIEDGSYGICLGTGKAISKARLKAIPYAEYCLEYQEELEKRR